MGMCHSLGERAIGICSWSMCMLFAGMYFRVLRSIIAAAKLSTVRKV